MIRQWMKMDAWAFIGASMVKYTTPLPCTGLSEIYSKSYTHFEFVKEKKS